LDLDPITHEHLDAMQTHFAGKVRERHLPRCKLHPKKCVWKRLFDDPFYYLWFSHICVKDDSKA